MSVEYFLSKEVADAARRESLVSGIGQLSEFSGKETLWDAIRSALLEQTDEVIQQLCVKKQCPFVNECIRNIVFAACEELANAGEEIKPEPLVESLQQAEELTT